MTAAALALGMGPLWHRLGPLRVRSLLGPLSLWRPLSSSCPMSKTFVINSNDEFEQKVMNSAQPVIVNFHADWCEPCKILTPRLEKLVTPLENVHLAVIDVEKNVELVHTFEVKAVPAVLAVRNGQVEDKFIGLVDGDMIDSLIKKLSDAPTAQPVDKPKKVSVMCS